jgi:hypothetical protein
LEKHPAVFWATFGDRVDELAGGLIGFKARLWAAHVCAHPSGMDRDDDPVLCQQPCGANGDGVEGSLRGVVADVPANLRADGHGGETGGKGWPPCRVYR